MSLPEDESEYSKKDDDLNGICSYLRLRPINKLEKSKRSKHCINISANKKVKVDSKLNGTYEFSFDQVGE